MPNSEIRNTYVITEQIGKGGTSIVYKAWHKNLRKYVVLKQILIQGVDEATLRRETDILKNLHHSNLPQIYDYFVENGYIYSVMDYIDGRDMSRIPCGIKNLKEETIVFWLQEMADVLSYIHRMQVIHSDIKPGNVIVTQTNHICLIDFNISLSGRQYGKVQGFSTNYASPEQVQIANAIMSGNRPNMVLDASSDIYSTGALFYYLMTGRLPSSLSYNTPLTYENCGYSEELCNVINRCMQWNRNHRIKDGTHLKNAVNQMRKHTKAYRKLVIAQVTTMLASALFIAAGSYCVIHGIGINHLEKFNTSYNAFLDAYNEADYSNAETLGIALLNDENNISFLEKNETQKAGILHTLGDIYFYSENYSAASSYYEEAVALEENENYYLDYALSCVYAKDFAKAESILNQFWDDSEYTKLIQAAMYFQSEEYENGLSVLKPLLSSSNTITAHKANELAADIAKAQGKVQETITYLESAEKAGGDLNTQRKLGEMYMTAASSIQLTSSQKEFYGDKALSQYRKICSSLTASKTDQLNYAVILLYLGKNEESIRQLNALLSSDESDYRIYMYLAFAYDAMNDTASAKQYAQKANEKYQSSRSSYPADAEAIQKMQMLAKR